jgi:hypothetical protein
MAIEFDPRQRQEMFPLASVSKSALEAHSASCPVDSEGPFPGAKERARRDADHSPHLAPRL